MLKFCYNLLNHGFGLLLKIKDEIRIYLYKFIQKDVAKSYFSWSFCESVLISIQKLLRICNFLLKFTGNPVEHQCLVWCEKRLEEGKTFSEYEIEEGDIITVFTTLRG